MGYNNKNIYHQSITGEKEKNVVGQTMWHQVDTIHQGVLILCTIHQGALILYTIHQGVLILCTIHQGVLILCTMYQDLMK